MANGSAPEGDTHMGNGAPVKDAKAAENEYEKKGVYVPSLCL